MAKKRNVEVVFFGADRKVIGQRLVLKDIAPHDACVRGFELGKEVAKRTGQTVRVYVDRLPWIECDADGEYRNIEDAANVNERIQSLRPARDREDDVPVPTDSAGKREAWRRELDRRKLHEGGGAGDRGAESDDA